MALPNASNEMVQCEQEDDILAQVRLVTLVCHSYGWDGLELGSRVILLEVLISSHGSLGGFIVDIYMT